MQVSKNSLKLLVHFCSPNGTIGTLMLTVHDGSAAQEGGTLGSLSMLT